MVVAGDEKEFTGTCMISLPTHYPVACHTDNVGPNTIFVAIKGMKSDGIQFIIPALEKGARTIIIEQGVVLDAATQAAVVAHHGTVQQVPNTRAALAELSAKAHNFPAEKLKIIGITGTKGKSTTTFLVEHMLRTAGYKTALLSTIKNKILTQEFPTQLTTQQPDYIHMFLAACVSAGVEWVVMEVAAQAFSLHRVDGILFDAAIFTNFSQEHAEFYPTLDSYFAAKSRIVDHLKPTAALILNAEDARVAQLQDRVLNAHFFSLAQDPNYSCPSLIGTFNRANIAACCKLAEVLGITPAQQQQALATFTGVPGRLEKYGLPNGATAFIDYAHNPSSYEAVLSTVRGHTPHLITIFGAGGERDVTKRPIMGGIAAQFADLIILTSDNPRSEDPAVIVEDIMAGIPADTRANVLVELDREKAIQLAYAHSRPGSIMIMLGKGPDEYQLVKGVKTYFSEREIVLTLS